MFFSRGHFWYCPLLNQWVDEDRETNIYVYNIQRGKWRVTRNEFRLPIHWISPWYWQPRHSPNKYWGWKTTCFPTSLSTITRRILKLVSVQNITNFKVISGILKAKSSDHQWWRKQDDLRHNYVELSSCVIVIIKINVAHYDIHTVKKIYMTFWYQTKLRVILENYLYL